VFVLGVDPGLTRCGYGCVADEHGREIAVAAGIITTEPHLPLPERLAELRSELVALVHELQPAVVVVERVFFQTNARTAMSVGQASGIALVSAAEAGCPVVEYSANEVKLAVAGYGAATKEQVQRMVAELLRLPELPRPPDVADALALALCHLASSRATRLAASGSGRA
jgi:crossover junction endodeoxyribonuclease RuvC